MFQPIDLRQWTERAIEILYSMLYPYLIEDFVHLRDHAAIHAQGNQVVVEGVVLYNTIQPDSNSLAQAARTQHETRVQEGDAWISSAKRTGTA